MSWASMSKSGSDMVVGNLTVLGELTLSNPNEQNQELNDINTNLISDISGNINLDMSQGNFQFNGDVICNGEFTMNSGANIIQAGQIITNSIENSSNTSSINLNNNQVVVNGTSFQTNQVITNSLMCANNSSSIFLNNGQIVFNGQIVINQPLYAYSTLTTTIASNQNSNYYPIAGTFADSSTQQQIDCLPNAGLGNWNPIVGQNDCVIFSNSQNGAGNSVLTLTSHSNNANGIRIGNDFLYIFGTSIVINSHQFTPVYAYGSNFPGLNKVFSCTLNSGSYAQSSSYIITCTGCQGIISVSSNAFSTQTYTSYTSGTYTFQ